MRFVIFAAITLAQAALASAADRFPVPKSEQLTPEQKKYERGVADLIGVSGYYTAVSMALNVAQVPLPGGGTLPLKPIE